MTTQASRIPGNQCPRAAINSRGRGRHVRSVIDMAETTLPLLPKRLSSKIGEPDANGCWPWLGRTHRGYGQFDIGHRPTGLKTVAKAHRVVYEISVGRVPGGMVLDHLCRNRSCVNPTHLEVVTQRVNILRGEGLAAREARQTHCIHGHPFDDENTYVLPSRPNARYCKECSRQSHRKRRKKEPE